MKLQRVLSFNGAFFPPQGISVKKINFIVVRNSDCLSVASFRISDNRIDF